VPTALLEEAGCEPGQFFVRSRAGKKSEYVLCVAYKGKPTHHLIGKNEDGIYAINKKTFGDFDKLKPLIMALSKPGVKGWPVQLTKPVNVQGGSDEPAEKKAAPKKAAATPKKAAASPKKVPAKKAGSGKPAYLHGPLSKEEATGTCAHAAHAAPGRPLPTPGLPGGACFLATRRRANTAKGPLAKQYAREFTARLSRFAAPSDFFPIRVCAPSPPLFFFPPRFGLPQRS